MTTLFSDQVWNEVRRCVYSSAEFFLMAETKMDARLRKRIAWRIAEDALWKIMLECMNYGFKLGNFRIYYEPNGQTLDRHAENDF